MARVDGTFCVLLGNSVIVGIIINEDSPKYVLENIKGTLIGGSASSNIPIWFLLSLGIVKLLANRLMKFGGELIIIVTLLLSILLFILEIKRPLYLAYTITGLFFYASGYYLREHQFTKKVLVVALLIVFLNVIIEPSFVHLRSNRLEMGSYVLWMLSSVSAAVAINYLFRWLPFKIFLLSCIGRMSLIILVTHWIILNMMEYVANKMEIESIVTKNVMYVVPMILLIPIYYVFVKKVSCKFLG